MTKVIGYVRVSTTKQDFSRQVDLIEQICTIHNFELLGIYDDKQSGATTDRAGYQKILNLPNNAANYIIVAELSRLTRQNDMMEAIVDFNKILRKGIGVQLPNGNDIYNMKVYEPNQEFGFADMMEILFMFYKAAAERKDIFARMQTGKRYMFSSNPMMCVSKAPFGYSKVDNAEHVQYKTPTSYLVRNENAKHVEMMFRWCADGLTITEIHNRLAAMGVNVPLPSIGHILHNEKYKGVWSFDRKSRQAIVMQGDAIVSEELFERAQNELQKHIANKRGKVNFHLLKGIIKCGECGHNMTIIESRGKLSYRCISQVNAKAYPHKCENGRVLVDVANMAVWNTILCNIKSTEFLSITNDELRRIDEQIKDADDEIITKSKDAALLKKDMDNLAVNMSKVSNPALFDSLQMQFEKMDNDYKAILSSIDEVKAKKAKQQETKKRMQTTINYETLKNMTDEQKAPIIKRYVSAATYYHESRKCGFLVVTFANGLEIVNVITPNHTVQLSNKEFDFIKETRRAKFKDAQWIDDAEIVKYVQETEFCAADFAKYEDFHYLPMNVERYNPDRIARQKKMIESAKKAHDIIMQVIGTEFANKKASVQ